MKASEIISTYRDSIESRMVELYRSVLDSEGRIQYQLYIWDDGELADLEAVQGSNTYLQPREYEKRRLVHVARIDIMPNFDPWDYTDDPRPDDEDEREEAEAEIIDWLVDEYAKSVSDTVDDIISEYERDDFGRYHFRV